MQSRKSSMVSIISVLTLAGALALAGCGGADIPPSQDDDPDGSIFPIDAGVDARIECPDPEPAPANCDFFLSCGCNVAAGEKCSIELNSKDCVLAGAKGVGENCVLEGECEAGTLCAVYGSGKRCMQYCDSAHACTATTTPQACYINVNSAVEARVCGQLCDLRAQDCEFPEQGCYPSAAAGAADKGICVTADTGGQGASCLEANDCQEGFTCSTTDNKCRQLCDRGGGAPTCTTGTCSALVGHTATGVCL